jgi:hypothetical protein
MLISTPAAEQSSAFSGDVDARSLEERAREQKNPVAIS